MGASFLITLREGIEAALIVSIILAYLNTIGRRDRHRAVWGGVGAAAGVSLVAGVIVFLSAGSLSEGAEQVFEGLVAFAAVGVLTWMIFWMRRQARFLKGSLQEKVSLALESGSTLALAALAFFVVAREGLETVLFLFATVDAATVGSPALALTGAVLGLATAFVLGFLLYKGGIRLNLRTFFKVTGALVLLVAAGLLANGIHELQEAGWIAGESAKAFDLSGVLSDQGTAGSLLKAMFGYNADPSVLEFFAWLGYLLVTGFLFFRPSGSPAPQPSDAERTTQRA